MYVLSVDKSGLTLYFMWLAKPKSEIFHGTVNMCFFLFGVA